MHFPEGKQDFMIDELEVHGGLEKIHVHQRGVRSSNDWMESHRR
jgi:hypothetical protein